MSTYPYPFNIGDRVTVDLAHKGWSIYEATISSMIVRKGEPLYFVRARNGGRVGRWVYAHQLVKCAS